MRELLLSLTRELVRNFDLYALILAGVIFTILGYVGISNIETLSSAILGLMTLLAFSQVRTRRSFDSSRGQGGVIFLDSFPDDLYAHRDSTEHDWLYVGLSGYRVVGSSRLQIMDMLRRQVKVRVLLLDYERECLLESAAARSKDCADSNRLKDHILQTISEIQYLQRNYENEIEVRLLPFVPTVGINCFDSRQKGGTIYIQHYEHNPRDEPAPIYRLQVSDGYWYQRQLDEAERMWIAGRPA